MSRLFRCIRSLFPLTLLFGSVASAQGPEQVSADTLAKLLKPWKEKIEKSRRDTVIFELAKGDESLLASKVGGRPFLPKGQSLPKGSNGEEMYLLAQINFAELPELPDYPRNGLLQFFISANDHYGANFSGQLGEEELSQQKDFRVIFHENLTAAPAEFSYPPKAKGEVLLPIRPERVLRMKFRKVQEIVGSDDFEFESVFGMNFYQLLEKLQKESSLDESILEESLEAYFSAYEFQNKLGGYASFTQEDPRREGSRKRLLLQIVSDQDKSIDIMWGDLGVAGFFIDPAQLKNKDFSHVMYNWDCG